MEPLEGLVKQLDKINNDILYQVDDSVIKKLKLERINIISLIDDQCKMIRSTVEPEPFNQLIKKYLKIQQSYRDKELDLCATQLMIMQNITKSEAIKMVNSDMGLSNMCLVPDLYFVSQRHKDIIKLENSLQELKELFIHTYALVNKQGETINHIANKVNDSKINIKEAKEEFTEIKRFKS